MRALILIRIIVLLLVLSGVVCAAPDETWSKTFGGTSRDWAFSVQQTSDGGYILAGETWSYGAGYSDFWLVKTDSDGKKEWDKTFGGTDRDKAESVQQTRDGGYIIAGETSSYGAGSEDFWLVKTDSSGNKEWDKTFGGTNDDVAYSVQQTSDDGYIIAGETSSYGAGYSDFWLLKTDSSGNKEWDKTFGGAKWDGAQSVQQTRDGGYILTGCAQSYGAGLCDFWLVKTDSSGNKEWDKTFGGTRQDSAKSVQQTDDGGYIFAGFTQSYDAGHYNEDFWLVKTDSNGNKAWDKTFRGSNDDRAESVQQTSDGGYILAGFTQSYGAGNKDFWLLKTDSDGNKEWDKTFGGGQRDWAFSVQQTDDGGYILAGVTGSYGAGSSDFWLVKTDSMENVAAPTPTPTPTPVVTSRSTPEQITTPTPQDDDSSILIWVGLVVGLVLLTGLKLSRKSKPSASSTPTSGTQTSTQMADPQVNEAERVIQSTETALQAAMRKGVNISQGTQQLLQDAQKSFATGHFATAKEHAHKCNGSIDAAVKEFEQQKAEEARKKQEQRDIEQQRKGASERVETAKQSLGKARKLGIPALQNAEQLLSTAENSFNSRKYVEARNTAEKCQDTINKLINENKPEIILKLPTRMEYNVWKHRNITITNNGTAHAKNITINFSKALDTRDLETIPGLKRGEEQTIKINIKPTEAGDVPVDYTIKFKDMEDRTYQTDHTTTIQVDTGTEITEEKTEHEPTKLEIKRGYEVLPNNDLRFGIRVANNSGFIMVDVQTILDYPQSLLSLRGDVVQNVGNINPNGKRTARYVLTPLGCVHQEKINAIIMYQDHTGKRHTVQMQGKEVHCVCPFLREKAMREGEFAELAAKSEYIDAGLSFSGIKTSEITAFIEESCTHRLHTVSEHKIDDTTVLYLAGESMGEKAYYILTAVIQPYKDGDVTQIALRAHSNKTHGLHGFLNEITESIRHLVGSVQSAKEIGIIENKQVINIIDSVVQRTSFGNVEYDSVEVNIKGSVVQRSQIDSTRR